MIVALDSLTTYIQKPSLSYTPGLQSKTADFESDSDSATCDRTLAKVPALKLDAFYARNWGRTP
jgi:hypothetical protein